MSPARRLAPFSALLLAACCASCGTLRSWFPGRYDAPKISAEQVPAKLTEAEEALAAEEWAKALRAARAVEKVRGIDPILRQRAQSVLEQAADLEMRRLIAEENADRLRQLAGVDLPRQIVVSASLAQARILFDRGKLMKAFRVLQGMDQKYPLHHERYAAASLLVDIGLTLAEDPSGFLWWTRRDDGVAVLEYLVLNAPWEPRCDEAYFTLAECYREDREWPLAIERHADLLLYHPDSALRPLSQALVPRLRLEALRSPEYDRAQLLKARRELEAWLATYGGKVEVVGPGIERGVRLDFAGCLRRLVDSDLGIARFYRRVGNEFGQRLHATRALEVAEIAGDDQRIARARSLLVGLAPAAEPLPGPALEPDVDATDALAPEQVGS